MENWERDFQWLRVRHFLKDKFNRTELPDMNAVLFLIGIRELGHWKTKYSKEEKQDLMHIATCRLLSIDGYYTFKGIDADGWPHWEISGQVPLGDLKQQTEYLQEKIIQYFAPILEQ